MFDTNKVATNIKNARTKKNMTQMNLADEMGVSYQAVSNWERGSSMPDISKLPELCKILELSFEELVEEKSEQTDIAEKLMNGEESDVSLEEIVQVIPLVEPEKLEVKVEEAIHKEEKISFATLLGLAPFISRDKLGKMVEEADETDLKKLTGLAPFLKRETLDKILEKQIKNESLDSHGVVGLAPFLSRKTVQKIAEYLISHGRSGEIVALAPFMGGDFISKIVKDVDWKTDAHGAAIGVNVWELDEEEADEQAFAAWERGEDVEDFLDYMSEEGVDKLALKALEAGKNTEIFLDYMSEEGVEELALKALEAGKSVEEYLDYMDEDVIKKLLLKAIRRK